MANLKKQVPENVEGNFFVDTTCIDCGTCRQLAPRTFAETSEYSYVYHQPQSETEEYLALQALVSCPTGSIGTQAPNRAKQVMQAFPVPIEDDVYYCGFTSPKSFGASSYFVRHPDGNWLIDSPKYLPNLVQKFQALGGIRFIFLSHSDDVAEAHRYADTFNAQRIFHREELWSQPETEIIIDGFEDQLIHPDFRVIPTPGHTRGHCVLLYRNCYLFTGDHIWWNPDQQRLELPTFYYWNQAEQVRSTRKLLDYSFEWILPGHGNRVHLPKPDMREALETLLDRKAHSLNR